MFITFTTKTCHLTIYGIGHQLFKFSWYIPVRQATNNTDIINPEIYAINISQLNFYKAAWTFKEHGYMFRLLRANFKLWLKRRSMLFATF